MPPGIALYDHLLVRGGAERTLMVVGEELSADLCVGSLDPLALATGTIPREHIVELGALRHPLLLRHLSTARAFRSRAGFISRYDWALYSGTYAPLAVHHRERDRNYYYCHTIPRFIYDLREHYQRLAAGWQWPLLRALIAYVRPRYEAAIAHMDQVIANSVNVQQRLQRYLGRDSVVVYPPCDVDSYHWEEPRGYYLSTARLENLKRVDLIIEAFRRLPQRRLIVTSGGSAATHLRRLAAGAANIEFTGWVDDDDLHRLLAGAIATIYIPEDEDFGMSPVESMAAGKPVIGVAEGGLLETVTDGETGILLGPEITATRLRQAVETLDTRDAARMRRACEARAAAFSRQRFVAALQELLNYP